MTSGQEGSRPDVSRGTPSFSAERDNMEHIPAICYDLSTVSGGRARAGRCPWFGA
jgi:hypothetical protein